MSEKSNDQILSGLIKLKEAQARIPTGQKWEVTVSAELMNSFIAVIETGHAVIQDWIYSGKPSLEGNIGRKQLIALEKALEEFK
jgi:hypothetical protein